MGLLQYAGGGPVKILDEGNPWGWKCGERLTLLCLQRVLFSHFHSVFSYSGPIESSSVPAGIHSLLNQLCSSSLLHASAVPQYFSSS